MPHPLPRRIPAARARFRPQFSSHPTTPDLCPPILSLSPSHSPTRTPSLSRTRTQTLTYTHPLARAQDYCGYVSEEVVRKNFLLVYELLDEIMDYGLPQVCASVCERGRE